MPVLQAVTLQQPFAFVSIWPMLAFLLGGLIVLAALVALGIWLIAVTVRLLRLRVSQEALSKIVTSVGEPYRLALLLGFILTVLFGIPSFAIALYDGSSVQDKQFTQTVLRWLLGGWGFGSGVSLVMLFLAPKKHHSSA
jgi:hypothetical protein